MNKRSWKTISSTVKYHNPFMRVREDLVERSNGLTGPYYVLERNGPFSIIIPITGLGETFLVGQYRYPTATYSWEFPMGSVKGKTPLGMAKLELLQETGITAKIYKKIGRFFIASGHCSQDAHVFVATGLTQGKPQPEPGEILEVKKATFAEIDRMVKKGKILDGPTITALYLYYQSIKKI